MTLQSRGLARSRDKVETFFLHHHMVAMRTYGHQTWQGSYLPVGVPTHKVRQPFDHMVFQNYMTN